MTDKIIGLDGKKYPKRPYSSALMAYYRELGYTVREIAEKMDCSISTVAKHLKREREKDEL